jgi:hypothetical protein
VESDATSQHSSEASNNRRVMAAERPLLPFKAPVGVPVSCPSFMPDASCLMRASRGDAVAVRGHA